MPQSADSGLTLHVCEEGRDLHGRDSCWSFEMLEEFTLFRFYSSKQFSCAVLCEWIQNKTLCPCTQWLGDILLNRYCVYCWRRKNTLSEKQTRESTNPTCLPPTLPFTVCFLWTNTKETSSSSTDKTNRCALSAVSETSLEVLSSNTTVLSEPDGIYGSVLMSRELKFVIKERTCKRQRIRTPESEFFLPVEME